MLTQKITLPQMVKTLQLSSEAFSHHSYIPEKYTCDGENINPPLYIGNIPENTKSLVVIMDDPDAPYGDHVHWIVWNIPPSSTIQENNKMGINGTNDYKRTNYSGPCPASGTHKYLFKVYALDSLLNLEQTATKHDLEEAMSRFIVGIGELVGLYKGKL